MRRVLVFLVLCGFTLFALPAPASAQPYDVVGGDPFYNRTSPGRCSIGFSVTVGYVTAGHCGKTGDVVYGYNQQPQGVFRGSSFPGNDYAWVETNLLWHPRPWVRGPNGTVVEVHGSQEAPVGAQVCRFGPVSGRHCGTILAKNVTITYPQGTVHGLTRTNLCSEPGETGGPIMAGNQAQGLVSGGSGNCSSGGTTYFQPINPILARYGLTLVTA